MNVSYFYQRSNFENFFILSFLTLVIVSCGQSVVRSSSTIPGDPIPNAGPGESFEIAHWYSAQWHNNYPGSKDDIPTYSVFDMKNPINPELMYIDPRDFSVIAGTPGEGMRMQLNFTKPLDRNTLVSNSIRVLVNSEMGLSELDNSKITVLNKDYLAASGILIFKLQTASIPQPSKLIVDVSGIRSENGQFIDSQAFLRFGLLIGDFNQNGVVDYADGSSQSDVAIATSHFGFSLFDFPQFAWCDGNFDTKIDLSDLGTTLSNTGKSILFLADPQL